MEQYALLHTDSVHGDGIIKNILYIHLAQRSKFYATHTHKHTDNQNFTTKSGIQTTFWQTVFLIVILTLLVNLPSMAQNFSERFRIGNKTDCYVNALVTCDDASATSYMQAITPQAAYWTGLCPTDSQACHVKIDFGQNSNYEIKAPNLATTCITDLGTGAETHSCYSSTFGWYFHADTQSWTYDFYD